MKSELTKAFLQFAEVAAPLSPLYSHLARQVASDPDLLQIAGQVPLEKLPPNMLFGAVHYLLQQQTKRAELAQFYASLTQSPAPADSAFPSFRQFVLENHAALLPLLQQRHVSTNEIQRAAILLPALSLVAQEGEPLHLIEVGCAAGFLLCMDRLGFDYGAAGMVGAKDSALVLSCHLEGALQLLSHPLNIGERVGLDLAPLEASKPEDAAWLRALIWPEQGARAARLESALTLVRAEAPRLVTGNANLTLEQTLRAMPHDGQLVVFHAFALAQFPAVARKHLLERLDFLGRRRPIWRVGFEHHEGIDAELVIQCHGRDRTPHLLGRAPPHGESLRWFG